MGHRTDVECRLGVATSRTRALRSLPLEKRVGQHFAREHRMFFFLGQLTIPSPCCTLCCVPLPSLLAPPHVYLFLVVLRYATLTHNLQDTPPYL